MNSETLCDKRRLDFNFISGCVNLVKLARPNQLETAVSNFNLVSSFHVAVLARCYFLIIRSSKDSNDTGNIIDCVARKNCVPLSG